MELTCSSLFFDEPTCRAVMDSLITERVQQSYGRFGECLLPELVFYRLPIMAWTGQALVGLKRPRRSTQDDHRVGPITRLKELWQWVIAGTTDLRQRVKPCLGDGVRLPLPQTIRRGNRLGHEAQTTSSDNGGDDD
jgi:hypothetical protein